MRLIRTANNRAVRITRNDWLKIGHDAGWLSTPKPFEEEDPELAESLKWWANKGHKVHGPISLREPVTRSEPKVGRNEPCPCKSGKKYKHCCGR